MRYKVMYDDLVTRWAVVDNKAAGLVIAYHETEDSAREEAELEERKETRWGQAS
jgi:hypothetical protein